MSRTGLMVGRFQPLHRGHLKSVNRMIQDCETAIIGLGSAQKSGEEHDPYTVEERMEMLRNVYGDRIKIVPLNDLNASSPKQWTDYIFEKLGKLGMKKLTDYYTGSEADAKWYIHCFWNEKLYKPYNGRYNGPNPKLTTEFTTSYGTRLLHLIDRDMNPIPPATDIRTYLSLRTDEWKQWVPRVNHDLVSSKYPEEFKVPKA